MALQASNTTCDIYRNVNGPPADPDVPGVKCLLTADFAASHLAATTGSNNVRWTHVMLVGPTVDVRDGYQGGTGSGETAPSGQDSVYVPDKNGTKFYVVFVERVGRGTSGDARRVYLQRQLPTWPTNDV